MQSAYDEILDFVTSAPSLSQIVTFEHSALTVERVLYLEQAEAEGKITDDEKIELREFEKALYFIEQLKIRAERRLQRGEGLS